MKHVREDKVMEHIKFDENKFNIRIAIDNMYDIQAQRIAAGNRVCTAFRATHGFQQIEESKEESKEDVKTLKVLMSEYTRITDAYAALAKNYSKALIKVIDATDATYIRTKFDYDMAKQYMMLVEQEEAAIKIVDACVKEHPMWDRFFKDVKGCGPAIS